MPMMAMLRRASHRPWPAQLLLALLVAVPLAQLAARATAQGVGYGPHFDACGDNCQTAQRIFCTEGRSAAQQLDCWCPSLSPSFSGSDPFPGSDSGPDSDSGPFLGSDSGPDFGPDDAYVRRMDACLTTCDPAVSRIGLQREVMLRFRAVVCAAPAGLTVAQVDPEFARYYRSRYAGRFVPSPTNQVPPPPVAVAVATAATMTGGRGQGRGPRTRTTTATWVTTTVTRTTTTTSSTSASTDTRTITGSRTGTSPTTPTTTAPPPAASGDGQELSAGAIAGISAAALVSFVAILLLVAMLLRRRRINALRRAHALSSGTPDDDGAGGSDGHGAPQQQQVALERRVSIYYSPDDVGIAPAARGAWRNGHAHPGVRVISPSLPSTSSSPSPSPSQPGTSDDDDDDDDDDDCSGSVSARGSGAGGGYGDKSSGYYTSDSSEWRSSDSNTEAGRGQAARGGGGYTSIDLGDYGVAYDPGSSSGPSNRSRSLAHRYGSY